MEQIERQAMKLGDDYKKLTDWNLHQQKSVTGCDPLALEGEDHVTGNHHSEHGESEGNNKLTGKPKCLQERESLQAEIAKATGRHDKLTDFNSAEIDGRHPFVCGVCYFSSRSIAPYHEHFKVHDIDIHFDTGKHLCVSEITQDPVRTEHLKCHLCSCMFPTICVLHDHLLRCVNDGSYIFDNLKKTAFPLKVHDLFNYARDGDDEKVIDSAKQHGSEDAGTSNSKNEFINSENNSAWLRNVTGSKDKSEDSPLNNTTGCRNNVVLIKKETDTLNEETNDPVMEDQSFILRQGLECAKSQTSITKILTKKEANKKKKVSKKSKINESITNNLTVLKKNGMEDKSKFPCNTKNAMKDNLKLTTANNLRSDEINGNDDIYIDFDEIDKFDNSNGENVKEKLKRKVKENIEANSDIDYCPSNNSYDSDTLDENTDIEYSHSQLNDKKIMNNNSMETEDLIGVDGENVNDSNNTVTNQDKIVWDMQRPYTCELCPRSYKYFHSLVSHEMKVHGLEGRVKPSVDKKLKPRADKKLKQSVNKKLKQCVDKKLNLKEDKRLKESVDKKFTQSLDEALKRRVDRKLKQKNAAKKRRENGYRTMVHVTCEICNKRMQKCRLDAHYTSHSDERPYKCDQCPKTYKYVHHLQEHKTSHNDVLPYYCDKCGKGYINIQQLNDHWRHNHSDVRPFECTICGAGFITKSKLKRHTIQHTGEKKAQCDLCGMGFAQKNNLKVHMLGVHRKEKRFPCSQCDRDFMTNYQLKCHMMKHSGMRPYKCAMCVVDFIERKELRRHMKKQHDMTLDNSVVPDLTSFLSNSILTDERKGPEEKSSVMTLLKAKIPPHSDSKTTEQVHATKMIKVEPVVVAASNTVDIQTIQFAPELHAPENSHIKDFIANHSQILSLPTIPDAATMHNAHAVDKIVHGNSVSGGYMDGNNVPCETYVIAGSNLPYVGEEITAIGHTEHHMVSHQTSYTTI